MTTQPLSPTGPTATPLNFVLPVIPLDKAESERIALMYLQENPEREAVVSLETTTGYYAYLINGNRWRDRQRILSMIDLEAVLIHYGLEIDYGKTSPGGSWRVYRWPNKQIKQRIGVVQPEGSSYKLYGFLNKFSFDEGESDASFPTKGNVLTFINLMERQASRVFKVVDELAASAAFMAICQDIDTLAPSRQQTENAQGYSSFGEQVREEELRKEYTLQTIRDSQYLESRGIPTSTQERAAYWGKILFAKRTYIDSKSQQERTGYYTTFPLTGHTGSILSLSLRNRYTNLFPKGIRGDSLWRSNDRGRLLRDLVFPNITLEAQTEFYYALTHQQVYLATPKFRLTVKRALWEKLIAEKPLFEPIAAKEIVLGEAPVDLISHSILFPRKHHTIYIATCGRMSRLAAEHIRTILGQHPGATLTLATDNDEEGLRFALNYLSFGNTLSQYDQQVGIKVRAKYILPEGLAEQAPGDGPEAEVLGSTHLEFELRNPLKGSIKTLDLDYLNGLMDHLKAHAEYFGDKENVLFLVEPYQEEQIAGSSLLTLATLTVPDRSIYLREILFSLIAELTRRQGGSFIEAQPYKGDYKDFNEWLQKEQHNHQEQAAQSVNHE